MKHSLAILRAVLILLFTVIGVGAAVAQEPQTESTEQLLASNAAELEDKKAKSEPLTFEGYVEGFYQWNFNNPDNGITNFRGFDNRHNTFTLANVALGVQWDYQNIIGRLTLQVGHTPATYYGAEPALPGAAGANASNSELWKYVQQAYGGYRFDVGRGLLVTAGVFLSPIGPEGMAVRDNWNWSRSNLFFGLPFYHTGVRAAYPLSKKWTVALAGYNGWNSVVDNNAEKSLSAQLTYTHSELLALSFLYFGGVERAESAPEGDPWRHLLDAHATWHVAPRLSLLLHANAGFEPNNFGTSSWIASALYARVQLLTPLFVVVRGDVFYEHKAGNAQGTASPMFWPVSWVSSGTLTLDYRPHEQVSFRLECRHDQAEGSLYFDGNVTGDGINAPYVPNADSQDTLTLGMAAWF